MPDDIKEVSASKGESLSSVLLKEGVVSSVGEFKRLVIEGAVNIHEGEEIKDFNYAIIEPIVVKVGKRRFISIKI